VPDVLGDAGRIGQVFLNLMMNALDALSDEGRLQISCMFQEGCVVTTFQDSGQGISSEKINRIFDPFFTTKNVGEGTGLGLSIAHGIVEDHKGWMTVESVEGRGAIFQVYLPTVETASLIKGSPKKKDDV